MEQNETGPTGRDIAERMILGNEVVKQRLFRRAPHLLKLQGPQRPQGYFQRSRIQEERRHRLPARGAPGGRVAVYMGRGW